MNLRAAATSLLFGSALAAGGCAGGATAVAPPAPELEPAAIRAIPGYASSLVEDRVFGGQVMLSEAGPAAAPTLVLIHGLGDQAGRDWYPILPALAERHHVIFFDLPGFGRSTPGTGVYSPERYARFVRELLRARVNGTFDLVGHSMGGAIALLYAARYPEDVERLLLIDVAGILHLKTYTQFALEAGLGQIPGVLGPTRELATTASTALLGLSPDASQFLLDNDLARRQVLGTPTRIAALALLLQDFGPSIASVRAPTLLIWGKHDTIAPLRTAHLLQRRLPRAELELLDESGHEPMRSEPARLARLMLERLAAPTGPIGAAAAVPPVAPSTRVGRCDHQHGVRFAGNYSEIELVGCEGAELSGVTSGSIRVRDSAVSLENTTVVTPEVALVVSNSRVVATACDFTSKVAVQAERSELDLAGVDLRGQQASVHAAGPAWMVFSVSRVDSPRGRGFVHGVRELRRNDEL